MSGRFFELIIALLLIILGILFLLEQADVIDFDFWNFMGYIWPIALIIIGLWLIYQQAGGKRKWKGSIDATQSSKAFGDLDISPSIIDAKGIEYKVGFGDIKLDLSNTRLQPSENLVRVSLGFGDLKLRLPKSKFCKISCTCGLGNLDLLGKKSNGLSVRQKYEDENYDTAAEKLRIFAKCGVGDLRVFRDQ